MNLTKTEQKFYDMLRIMMALEFEPAAIKISHKHLAKLLHCTPTTSHRNIKRLRDKGLIEIERPGGRENVYRLAG